MWLHWNSIQLGNGNVCPTSLQQELKSNTFSRFSVCNMSVWQCRGKKNKVFFLKFWKQAHKLWAGFVCWERMEWKISLFTPISEGSRNSPEFKTLSAQPRMEPSINLAWTGRRKYSRLYLQAWGMWWQLSQPPCCRSHFWFLLLLLPAQFCRNSAQVCLSSNL